MAQLDEQQDCIDIWRNSDGTDTVKTLEQRLLRIFTNPINSHDVATLSDASHYSDRNGTIIVVITDETLHMLNANPSLAFGRLVSNCTERYYIDEYGLLEREHNKRVALLSAENDCNWTKVDLNDYPGTQILLLQISHNTLKGSDSITTKRKQKKPSNKGKGKRGLFTVIPNEFWTDMLKRERTEDGVVVIDASVFENGVAWTYKGDPVTAYLVNHSDKTDTPNIGLLLTPVASTKVFKFKLPDDLKPSTYMIHVRDGDTPQSYELGNRSIKIRPSYSQTVPIHSDLFSEENLSALAGVPDLSTVEYCKAADEKLSDCFDRSQLPLKLPQFLGRKCPTLLHVACYYGLEKLFVRIMDSFCSLDSLNICNVDMIKPGELARAQEHIMLANLLANQLIIQDLYVAHAPAEATQEFHDIYTTVSFDSNDTSEATCVYVTNVTDDEVHSEDPEDIYFVAETLDRRGYRYSAIETRSTQPIAPPIQSRTLPRAAFNTGAESFMRDERKEPFLPAVSESEAASPQNGEVKEVLPQTYLRDWTKMLKSFKRLGLEDRLQGQRELVQHQKAVIKGQTEAPPIVPRNRNQSSSESRVKKLPAPPPPTASNGPPKPLPRQISKECDISRTDEVDIDSDYEIPIKTLPGSPRSEKSLRPEKSPRSSTESDTPPIVLPRQK